MVVAFVVCAAPAPAQRLAGLSGIVRDRTGAVLPGVRITLTAPGSAEFHTVTDSQGRYLFELPGPRRYQLLAQLSGFEPYTAAVDVTTMTTLDLVLNVAAVSERITITGLKMGETDIQTAPAAVTAVNGAALEARDVRAVNGLTGLAPGLIVAETPGGRVLATIRGVGTNTGVAGSDPSSTVYLDGVYLARAAAATMDFLDVERVEILRGPQGTLYGRNAVGGAIHIFTRTPANTTEARVRITAGNSRTLRAEAAVRGPIVRNRLMGSIAVLRGVRDGFVKDLDQPDHPLGGDDTWMTRAQLRSVIGARGELLLSADYGLFTGVPLPFAKPIVARPGITFDGPPSPWEVRTNFRAFARNTQGGGAAKFTWQSDARCDHHESHLIPPLQRSVRPGSRFDGAAHPDYRCSRSSTANLRGDHLDRPRAARRVSDWHVHVRRTR